MDEFALGPAAREGIGKQVAYAGIVRLARIQAIERQRRAGKVAAMMTSRYGTPVIAARIKAATPITGGMIDPPDEAAASMPPANTREKPRCIII